MATIHSQQLARKLFRKFACSALLALLLCATVLLSGAFYHDGTTFHDKLVPTNFLNRLFATRRSEKVETAALTGLHSQDSKTMVKRSVTETEMEAIVKGTELLQQQLEQALAKIEQNVQKNKDLAEQISRSPGAIKTIQALEAAIAIFDQTSQTWDTRYPSTPQETSAGNVLRPNIQCPSRICSSTMSKLARRKTRFWGRKLPRWSNKTYTWHNKPPGHTRHLQKDSKRTPSWVWSPERWPPTCSSSLTMIRSRTTRWSRMTFHHGDSHFSKRRSESKKEGNQKSESQKRKRERKGLDSKKKVGQQVKLRQK
jgi:hypothetical protein